MHSSNHSEHVFSDDSGFGRENDIPFPAAAYDTAGTP